MADFLFTAGVLLFLILFAGIAVLMLVCPVKIDRIFQANDAGWFGHNRRPQPPWVYRVFGLGATVMVMHFIWVLVSPLLRGERPSWRSRDDFGARGEPNYYMAGFLSLMLAIGLAMLLMPERVIPNQFRTVALTLDEGGSWRVLKGFYRAFGAVLALYSLGGILKALGS